MTGQGCSKQSASPQDISLEMNFGEEEACNYITEFKSECDKLCDDKALTAETCYLEEALFVLVSEGEYCSKTDEVRYKLTVHTNAVEDDQASADNLQHCEKAKELI